MDTHTYIYIYIPIKVKVVKINFCVFCKGYDNHRKHTVYSSSSTFGRIKNLTKKHIYIYDKYGVERIESGK